MKYAVRWENKSGSGETGEMSDTAILYDNGLHVWTEDLNGKVIIEGSDGRKVYFQTKAMGYDVHVEDGS